MKQLILFDHNNRRLEEVKTSLSKELTAELVEIKELDKLFSLVPILPDLDLIITNATPENLRNIDKLEQFLILNDFKVELFIIGDYQKKYQHSKVYVLNNDFIEEVKLVFLKNDAHKKEEELPLFVPVNFNFIEEYSTTKFPVDFYLRIKQSQEEFQYLKRLEKNQEFSNEELNNYRKHHLDNLYIRKDDYKTFLDFANLLLLSNASLNSKESSSLKNLSFSYHVSKEAIALIGLNEENVLLVKDNLKKMEDTITSENALVDFLKSIKENEVGYAYSHSFLLSIILSKLVASFAWDSKTIREKICFVAFFHDISLSEDKLSRIHKLEELYEEHTVEYDFRNDSQIKSKIFTATEIEQTLHHAYNSSLLLEKFKSVPMGVSQVVKEHHGSKNGIGFNDGQSITLQPLSMIFIVVEDFVTEFLKVTEPNQDDVIGILNKLTEKYKKGNYKKTIDALTTLIKR